MYHVNISLVRQINVKVNPWQNCQISISSVVRMARTNKFPINNRQIPKVPFSYSPLNSRWSHPPTRRLFTFIVNNTPSHVSIIIVFVIIALLQSNDEHFHRLIYIYFQTFLSSILPSSFMIFFSFLYLFSVVKQRAANIAVDSTTWPRYQRIVSLEGVFSINIYPFIYLFVKYFLSSVSLDKLLPNSLTTRTIVSRYPQDPSYEVYRLVKRWQKMRTEPRSSTELQKIARLAILRYQMFPEEARWLYFT